MHARSSSWMEPSEVSRGGSSRLTLEWTGERRKERGGGRRRGGGSSDERTGKRGREGFSKQRVRQVEGETKTGRTDLKKKGCIWGGYLNSLSVVTGRQIERLDNRGTGCGVLWRSGRCTQCTGSVLRPNGATLVACQYSTGCWWGALHLSSLTKQDRGEGRCEGRQGTEIRGEHGSTAGGMYC